MTEGVSGSTFDTGDALETPRVHRAARPLSVGVTVDLELAEDAGGHVKAWQRFAEAATEFPGHIDLTVYFLGAEEAVRPLSDTVRYHLLPPRRGTRQMGLKQGGGHTDLAARHPRLEALLGRHDVLHTSSAFALSRTAARLAREAGTPLIASLHTDLPYFARLYTAETIRNLLGSRLAANLIADGLGVADLSAWQMDRQVRRVLAPSRHVFYAQQTTRAWLAARLPDMPASLLRRGIDRSRFQPAKRDRARLAAAYGVPEDRPVLLFVGRVDKSKNVMVAARAARRLRDSGLALHFLALGQGAQRAEVTALLGADATAPGVVDQGDLAWLYASADVFVFPSRSETVGNVVVEARASGLPVAVAAETAPARLVGAPGQDGLVIGGDDPADWAAALHPLVSDAARRRAMGQAARAHVERAVPDWPDVVAADLLPVWTRVADDARLMPGPHLTEAA